MSLLSLLSSLLLLCRCCHCIVATIVVVLLCCCIVAVVALLLLLHCCRCCIVAVVALLLLLLSHCCHCHCCIIAVIVVVLLCCCHCHCHIIAAIVVAFIMSFGAHEGAGPRASAGGLSSVAWDAVAIVVCRGTGPRGPMDRLGCRKDLAKEHSLSMDAEWKSALQGCWTMGECTGRSSSIAWDWLWLVCTGALHQGQVLVGCLVLPGTLWPLLCAGVLDQEVQWTGQDTKRI